MCSTGMWRLDVECLDRIYLNGYVPNLQVGGQVVSFMTPHLGYPIPSPAILEKIGDRVPRGGGPLRRPTPYPGGAVRQGRPQDRGDAPVSGAPGRAPAGPGWPRSGSLRSSRTCSPSTQRTGHNGVPWFSFTKADRRVTCYYFYVWDADFGPAFIKICTYFPYPVKVWLNGHEWAKRQATQAGIEFSELSNGFATCADPAGLQAICDRLGPGTIGGVLRALDDAGCRCR